MIICILLSFLLGGIGMTPALNHIDSIIESDPDSAYVLLAELDRTSMSRRETAKFSVLYSMALDKKYIDIASDSIICNAVRYYHHHGNADWKMRAHYYLGVVRQNAGDTDGAMDAFVKAEHYGRKSGNELMRGRVYMGMKTIHKSLFNISSASIEAHNAAECFLAAGDTSRYINSLLDECGCLNPLKEYEKEEELLQILSRLQYKMSSAQKNNFLGERLLFDLESGNGTIESMRSLLGQMTSIQTGLWLDIAYLYLKYNDLEAAVEAINQYESSASADVSNPIYSLVRSKIYAAEEDYSDAYFALNKYISAKDSRDLKVMQSSAPFAEERFDHQIQELKQKNQRMVLVILFLLAALAAFIIKDRLVREKQRAENLLTEKKRLESELVIKSEYIEQANCEIKQLKRILSEDSLSKDFRHQVDVRLSILNKYVAHQISETSSKGGQDELKALLADRKAFLKSMVASFSITNPKFVQYLNDIGMTEKEAGCCCLYCIGLRGAEIASYLELSEQSYYNFSSKIRKKLGQESYKSNINVILKKILAECSQ